MPDIRGGLKRAFKSMEEDGRPLSTIWLELFRDDPVNAMRLAISCHPKEMMLGLDEDTREAFSTNQLSQEVMAALIAKQHDSQEPNTTIQ